MGMDEVYNVYTDGGARGNPGPAGCAAVIERCVGKTCQKISAKHKFIGEATNNQAEYRALIMALELLIDIKPGSRVNFYLDSQLVVEQINGNYKVKNQAIAELYKKASWLISHIKIKPVFVYISRERNKAADKLVNQAIDEGITAKAE